MFKVYKLYTIYNFLGILDKKCKNKKIFLKCKKKSMLLYLYNSKYNDKS